LEPAYQKNIANDIDIYATKGIILELLVNKERCIMQAVIRTGGKQYSVNSGDIIEVEKLIGNLGDEVEFTDVLLVSNDKGESTVGNPLVENAVVKAKILGEKKGKKIIVFKFKRRKDYRNKNGHRQKYTSVEITDIVN